MKKILFTTFTVYIVTMIFISGIHAQQSNTPVAFNQHSAKTAKPFTTNFDKNSFPSSHLSEINIKAVRSFERLFKGVENTHWYNVDNGLIVYFTDNGIKSRANYSKNGGWLSTIRSYAEEHLPKDIRAQVKREYYDYSITWINEISNETQLYYVVHMQDKTSWKNVVVCDGEMAVIEERIK
jgi:hypothetical protein